MVSGAVASSPWAPGSVVSTPVASKSSSGPGRAQRKGGSAEGRATPKGGGSQKKGGSRVGRYTPPDESGRYTPPVPRKIRRSSPVFGVAILALLIIGVLAILLNYLSVLPGGVSGWYLVAGLVLIFAGFIMATRYR